MCIRITYAPPTVDKKQDSLIYRIRFGDRGHSLA